MIATIRRGLLTISALACGVSVTACSPHRVTGKVVEGPVSQMLIVNPDDPRFDLPGIEGTQLTLRMDPQRPNRKVLAKVASGAEGEIDIPVDYLGAGWFEYDMGLTARHAGYQRADGFFKLPTTDKRVLIMLTPGRDIGQLDDDDPLDQVDQYWKK
ncbi:MAG TPA: hypothetical protein VG797_04285 [Phycisphaerales bacterium]|nr:hypothetical protein [Phycisphaerales bacterium]